MSRFITATLDGIEITRAKDVKKHGDHDQSSHGAWANGNGVQDEKSLEQHIESQPKTKKFWTLRDKYVNDDERTLSMNRNLRGNKPKLTEKILDTDNLCKTGIVKKDIEVYRGAVLPKEMIENLEEGKTFIDKGFQSTDISESSAKFYADMRQETGAKGEPTLFRMTLKKGLNAVGLGSGEVLVQRDARLKVTGKSKSGKYTIVDVEVTK